MTNEWGLEPIMQVKN